MIKILLLLKDYLNFYNYQGLLGKFEFSTSCCTLHTPKLDCTESNQRERKEKFFINSFYKTYRSFWLKIHKNQ